MTNRIVYRLGGKAKMVRDYGRHIQSGRHPIIASVSLSSVAGTMLGLFSSISGHALLHPIHLTVVDAAWLRTTPVAAIYARFFAEIFDPGAGLFETFNSAAPSSLPSTSTTLLPPPPRRRLHRRRRPPASPPSLNTTPHHASAAAAAAASTGRSSSLGANTGSSGTACLLPSVAAALGYSETHRLIGRAMVKCVLDGAAVPDLLAPSVYKYLLGERASTYVIYRRFI